MYFDRVVNTGVRLEAYFKDELVRVRVRGANGWVDVPIDGGETKTDIAPRQMELPVPRRKVETVSREPTYERFEEAP
jgi:hypothetical protein